MIISAYVLYENGFDVWLGNSRGNSHGRTHVYLTDQDHEFWDFSLHELGVYDVSACITYITDLVQDSVIYLGHSLGSITWFIYASQKPEEIGRVRAAFILAPPIFTGMKSPLGQLLERATWKTIKVPYSK